MKKSRLASIALFAIAAISAQAFATEAPATEFGRQLDCATQRAVNMQGADGYTVRKAVDQCTTAGKSAAKLVKVAAFPTTPEVQVRKEDLIEATRNRLDLCRGIGISSDKMKTSCPQLFQLDDLSKAADL
jgi:hypothetical protein